MALQIKTIKKRISSVKNIKKITRAMEMVAASKMRKAVDQALNTRTYAKLALELLVNVAKENVDHVLLDKREVNKTLVIVIGSNKGLCGGYNSNILKEVKKLKDCDFITVGKKAEKMVKQNHIASFIDLPEDIGFDDIIPLSKIVLDKFIDKTYDRVKIVYTDFVSSIKSQVKTRSLLPVSEEVLQQMIDDISKDNDEKENMATYIFEPDMKGLLDEVLPRLVEIQIYQSLLESNASEHSSRMLAMKNASDSASEMIDELTLYFNQARQAAITQEISEIASGAAALN